MTNLIQKHQFKSEEKLKWWGYGEWVEEPDEVEFEHLGFKCWIRRVGIRELYTTEIHIFGGHLCGYIFIEKKHPWFGKELKELDDYIDVHYGVTFCEMSGELYQIGFDCAHLCDYIPSAEYLKKRMPEFGMIRALSHERKQYEIFNPTYRNVQFCIDQCKLMAEQAAEVLEKK